MGVWERRILIGLALIAAVAVAYAGFRFAYNYSNEQANPQSAEFPAGQLFSVVTIP
jgi:hypothetical protein